MGELSSAPKPHPARKKIYIYIYILELPGLITTHSPTPRPGEKKSFGTTGFFDLDCGQIKLYNFKTHVSKVKSQGCWAMRTSETIRTPFLLLDCYWVGSSDFNFWGNQGVFHQAPKQLNFLQGGQQQPRLGDIKQPRVDLRVSVS